MIGTISTLFLVSLVLLSHLMAAAGSRDLQNMPNPMTNPTACGREHVSKSAICDPDHQLLDTDKDELEGFINKATNHAQIAVAVVGQINLTSFPEDATKATESFARGLHNQWGVGDAVKQDGVLILLSVNDHTVYLSIGQGTAAVLTPTTIQELIGLMRPYLKVGKYGSALIDCVIQIDHLLTHAPSSWMTFQNGLAFLGFIAIIIMVVGFKDHSRIERLERGRILVSNLQRAVDSDHGEENISYFNTTCPICLDDFGGSGTRRAPMGLQCGHVFCKSCLLNHVSMGGGSSARCPICRAAIDTSVLDVPQSAGRRLCDMLTFSWWMWPATSGSYAMLPAHRHDEQSMSDGIGLIEHNTHYIRHVPEIQFRLHRLHQVYPDILPVDQLHSLSSAVQQGEVMQLVDQLDTKQIELQTLTTSMRKQWHVQATGSGNGGSKVSFGGGVSAGGGGGSW